MAIKKAKGEYVALLNNDTELDKNWLKELIKVMQSSGKIGALASKILFMDGKIQSAGHQEYPNFYWGDRGFKEKDKGQYNRIEEVPSICGASVLYRRKCLEDAGLLDEDFIMYLEDVDMSIRCRDKKWKLYYVPKSIVRHAYNGTATNDLQSYYVERNRLLLIAKHYPKKLPDALSGRGYFTKSNLRKLEDILPVIVNKLVKSGHENNIVEMALRGLFTEIGKLNNQEKDSYYKEIEEMNRKIQEKDSLIKETASLFAVKDKDLIARDIIIRKKDEIIALLEKKAHDIKRLESELKDKDKAIKETASLFAVKDKDLAAKDSVIRKKEEINASLEKAIKEKEDEIISKNKKIYNLNTELAKTLESFQQQSFELKTRGDLTREKQDILLGKEELLKDKDKDIVFKNNELRNRDAEIQRLNFDLMKSSYDLKSLEKDIREKEKKAEELTARLDTVIKEKEAILAQKEELLKDKDKDIIFKNNELRNRDAEIQRLNFDLMKSSYDLKSLEKDIQEKELVILSKDEGMALKDRVIKEKEDVINKIKIELQATSIEKELCVQEKQNLEAELNKIYTSIFYKMFYRPFEEFKIFKSNLFRKLKVDTETKIAELKTNRAFMKFYDSNTIIAKILQTFHRKNNAWLKIYNEHLKSDKGPPKPERLILMLTKKCNLSCEFCNIHGSSEEMGTEDAIKVIDNIARLGIILLVITGGEPFLHKDLFKIVSHAKEKGLKVCITTNGSMMLDKIDDIVKSGVDTLSVSLDGIGDVHDKMRNKAGLFYKVQQGIDELIKRNCNVALNFVVTKDNVKELEKVYSWAKERNIYFDFWPVNYCKKLYINGNGDYTVLSRFVKRLRGAGEIRRYKYYYFRKTPLYLNDYTLRVRCLGLSRDMGVDVNGNIIPCCVWNRDSANLGNAITDDAELLWNSKRYLQIRRDIFHKGCSNGCYNSSLHEFMTITGRNFIVSCKKTSK
jgi:MoaA/NifB/PqqE/SkfB family radical SAM enzyme/GT2 family glycosyltransferase